MRFLSSLLCALLLTSCSSPRIVPVARVVDGDTIVVQVSASKTEKVRVVGIDTPETVDPRKPVQCYGKEASAKMKELVSGKTVTLERKPNENRDKYGRWLRYVMLDGKDIGAELIQQGYAHSYRAFPHPRLALYNRLEREAKLADRGLWGKCGGK